MNYLALRRMEPSGLHLWVRAEDQVGELVALGQTGDTVHKVPDELAQAPSVAALVGLCNSQAALKDCVVI